MIDPTREEWLAARERLNGLVRAWTLDKAVEAVLGCARPPKPAPEPFHIDGEPGPPVVKTVGLPSDGSLTAGIAIPGFTLDPKQAVAMAKALVEHAEYVIDAIQDAIQGDDPWRSDEEAAALIDAIKEPKVCGRVLDRKPSETSAKVCLRPKGHRDACWAASDA